jgi:hypothetical protein
MHNPVNPSIVIRNPVNPSIVIKNLINKIARVVGRREERPGLAQHFRGLLGELHTIGP